MTAINFVPNLFAGEKLGSDSQLLDYHTYLFENICKVVMASFVIEVNTIIIILLMSCLTHVTKQGRLHLHTYIHTILSRIILHKIVMI